MGTKTNVQVIFTITLDSEIEDTAEGTNIYPLGITISGRTNEKYEGDLEVLHKASSLAAARYWFEHAKELAGDNVSEITLGPELKS